ncbi:MAG: TolC family protein [Legionella sp.]|jgi:outer membrane protein TolC
MSTFFSIRTCNFFFIGLIIFLAIPEAIAKPIYTISYSEAVKLALSNNPGFKSNRANIEAAQGAIIETRGSAFPKLNLEMNAARSNNPLNVFGYKLSQGNVSFADFGAAQFTGPDSLYTVPTALNQPGYYSNLDTAFNLLVPIYSGGEKKARLIEARALLESAQHGNSAARSKLAYDILLAYEGVLASESVIAVTKKSVSAAGRFLDTTRKLTQQSLALESDVLLAESYLQSSETSVEAARMEWENHVDEFRTLIGLPESSLVPGKSVHFTDKNRSVSQLIRSALVNNPNLHEMKSNLKASAANIKAVKSANLPRINLQLRHDWNGETLGSGYPSNLIGLQMNWLLFSAGERSGIEQKAVAQFKKAGYQIDDAMNLIKVTLNKAIRADKLAEIQYKTHLINANKARKGVDLLSARYGRGLVPLGQLLEAQMRLNDARHQLILSEYNKKAAHGRLLMLTNELIKPFASSPKVKVIALKDVGVLNNGK